MIRRIVFRAACLALAYWLGTLARPAPAPPPAPPQPRMMLTGQDKAEVCTAWWFGNDHQAKAETAARMCGKKGKR